MSNLTLVKGNSLIDTGVESKLVTDVLGGKATIFQEHGTYFVGQDQSPGQLILGYGSTIEEAVCAAIQNAEG